MERPVPMERIDSPPNDLERLASLHARAFRDRFGASEGPARLFFAPGRVNLMGAHLDYNGGPVFPTAIDRGTIVALRPRRDTRARLASTLEERTLEAELSSLPERKQGAWFDYPLGVVRDLLQSAPGVRRTGFDVLFGGNLPIGAGLSSSASICVSTALAVDRAWGLGLENMERVHCALRAERGFVGVQCGIMDPYAVGLARPGQLLWLDCKDASWEHVPFPFDRFAIGVVDSGVRRELAQGEFNRRVSQSKAAFEHLRAFAPEASCLRDVSLAVLERAGASLDGLLRKRAQHVLTEVQRTRDAREAVRAGDFDELGRLMAATHASLRDLYEVSVPELDCIADAANACEGVLGARLTGAGFGGCAVMIVRHGAQADVSETVARAFERRFQRRPRIDFFGGDEGPRELA
jgi:galactokinase